jgi:radical SAM protein with 4Fe4S-binding SPASM domain
MSIDTFRDILDQIKGYTDYLYFHVKGEPLLHPRIDEFLDLSYEKGYQVNITTNGTRIQKVKEQLLGKPALRQINFSLHSFDGNEGTQEKDDYMEQILSFIKEAIERSEILLSMRLWNLVENNVINQEVKRNNELLTSIEREFDLPYKILEMVTPGRGIKIADHVYLNQDYEFKWPDLKEAEDDGCGFCYGLRNQVAILVDGTVVPCCLDGEGIIALGNIKNAPFSNIIENERANNFVNGFTRREAVEELCRKCGFRKRFG